MNDSLKQNQEQPENKDRSLLRNIAYGLLILILILTAMTVYSIFAVAKTTDKMLDPLQEFVRQLAIPATPVILPDPVTIVREMNDLARLETRSYQLQKVVTVKRNQDILFGAFGESLVFVAFGEIIAGVDLAKMEDDDIQVVDPETVIVHLPTAEIFVATLDNDKSFVADRNVGLLTKGDPQLETKVRQSAEEALLTEALELGILKEAQTNAEQYMIGFLNGLGFTNIIFTDDTPSPAPEYVQPIPKGFTGTPTPTP